MLHLSWLLKRKKRTYNKINTISGQKQVLQYTQASAVADESARRAASRQTCCEQRWTLSAINLRQRLQRSTFSSYSALSKVANFNLSHVHLGHPLGVTPFEFFRDLRHQESRVPGLSCSVVCVILRREVKIHQIHFQTKLDAVAERPHNHCRRVDIWQ